MAFLNFLKKKEVKEFIRENLKVDVQKLLLNPPRQFHQHMRLLADQLISRRKIRHKLPDWYQNLDLILPPPLSAEQASSEKTCDYKKSLIDPEVAHFVDLTGGLGADCLYLSEGISKVTYVELQENLCQIFQHNCEVLSRQVEVVHSTAADYVASERNLATSFLYLDPDRRDKSKKKLFKIEDCSPNLLHLVSIMQEDQPLLLVKYSPLLDIQEAIKRVDHVKEVHIVSVKNDCKELLLLIDPVFDGESTIHCVNLDANQHPYVFSFSGERSSTPMFAEAEDYLYEPNTSILKAGAFNSIAEDFDLKKIAANTHLYTADVIKVDFPGRVFEVLQPANKEALKKYAPERKINVLVRNHPLSTAALKAKWQVKDGGDFYLIGYRGQGKKPKLVVAKRIR